MVLNNEGGIILSTSYYLPVMGLWQPAHREPLLAW